MTEAEIAAKNIEGRACVACKWHSITHAFDYCLHPSAIIFDPVKGIIFRKCGDMRRAGSYLTLAGSCEEGKFFEPKDGE